MLLYYSRTHTGVSCLCLSNETPSPVSGDAAASLSHLLTWLPRNSFPVRVMECISQSSRGCPTPRRTRLGATLPGRRHPCPWQKMNFSQHKPSQDPRDTQSPGTRTPVPPLQSRTYPRNIAGPGAAQGGGAPAAPMAGAAQPAAGAVPGRNRGEKPRGARRSRSRSGAQRDPSRGRIRARRDESRRGSRRIRARRDRSGSRSRRIRAIPSRSRPRLT